MICFVNDVHFSDFTHVHRHVRSFTENHSFDIDKTIGRNIKTDFAKFCVLIACLKDNCIDLRLMALGHVHFVFDHIVFVNSFLAFVHTFPCIYNVTVSCNGISSARWKDG